MPSECRFHDYGTKATRFYNPNNGDDRMNENDEDVVHTGIVSKPQKLPEFRQILEFATDTLKCHKILGHSFPNSSLRSTATRISFADVP